MKIPQKEKTYENWFHKNFPNENRPYENFPKDFNLKKLLKWKQCQKRKYNR